MKALLLWPIMPNSFWSYQETLDLAGLKSTNPPLGLITIAAMLPTDWEIRFFDRNVTPETDADWDWCDLAIISAMIVQKADFQSLIKKGVNLGKQVAVGGPFATSIPAVALEAGAHHLILDEGECTMPLFLDALARGETTGIYRSTEKPDVTNTPIPRFDLLDLDAYLAITVQFSRGCPFQCEFCDIINLYGRKPRTKTPAQFLAELEVLYQMGWHRYIFIVDDNFIGNTHNAKILLRALIPWMEERNYPFIFLTEASVNLAEDDELIELMVKAGVTVIFMGIETPDTDSLLGIHKVQNTRKSLVESCEKVTRMGIQIMSGFIMGFDNERAGAGQRIQEFIEAANIPIGQFSLLQALQNTALWTRLEREGRLTEGLGTFHQGAIMNFIPTRPVVEITQEYIDAFWQMYEPMPYLKRTFRCFRMMNGWRSKHNRPITQHELRLYWAICWRQGVLRNTRFLFWWQLLVLAVSKPSLLYDYFTVLGVGEHFFSYRYQVRDQLLGQLAALTADPDRPSAIPIVSKDPVVTPV